MISDRKVFFRKSALEKVGPKNVFNGIEDFFGKLVLSGLSFYRCIFSGVPSDLKSFKPILTYWKGKFFTFRGTFCHCSYKKMKYE
jgi:hypothetical protein